ncbi:MAG: hypothetical protein LBS01_03570 [Prevotellaceae bacterium]|nr:hypothetical protein [Prevotellaceae bacterium]
MVNSFFEALYPSAHNEKSFFTERRAESPPYNSTGQRPVVWALPPSIPEALTGRNLITLISPFQGLFIVHSSSAGRCPALLIYGLSALRLQNLTICPSLQTRGALPESKIGTACD